MPEYDYIIGFDFGHGETSAALVDIDKVSIKDGDVPVEDIYICEHSSEPKITSLVGYDSDGNTEVDIDIYDFKRFESIESYFKGPLIASDEFEAISGIQKRHFRDFIITVFNRVKSNPKNVRLLGRNIRYFAACPSGWSNAQKTSYLSFLRNDCSLPIDGIIEESRAAHVSARKKLHERNRKLSYGAKRIVVLDLGSSTLDITLHSDKTYTDGYEIGASLIEEVLLNYFLKLNSDFKDYYDEYTHLNATGKDEILLFLRYAKENYFNRQKKYPKKDNDLICTINWSELSQDEIRGISILKIKGSLFTSLFIKGVNDNVDNKSVDNYENKLRTCIYNFIAKFGKADAVILTGGASQMGFYKDIVLDCFGLDDSACIVDDTPSYSISQGVAMIGYMDTKCPVFDPADRDAKLPSDLQEIFDNLPNLINDDILRYYKSAYTDSLTKVVDEWKGKKGKKTLSELMIGFDQAIRGLEDSTESISKQINSSVGANLSRMINKTLQDTIRLYFGFDAPICNFEVDYSFKFSVPGEDNKNLYQRIEVILENYINNRGLFHRWRGVSSFEKDRSNDKQLLEELPSEIKAYINRWYARYKIGNYIQEEVSDCRDRLRDFYASTIRNITCQI